MSDSDFEGGAPRRKGIPGWLWATCGVGCLALVVILGVGGFMFVKSMKEMAENMDNPDVQWPALAEVLPHDTRPEGMDIKGMKIPLMDLRFWLVENKEQRIKAQFVTGSKDMIAGMQDGNANVDFGSSGGDLPWSDDWIEEQGILTLQGTDLDVSRYYAPEGAANNGREMRGIEADLSTLLGKPMYMRLSRSWGDPLTDDSVIRFLSPFQIGQGF